MSDSSPAHAPVLLHIGAGSFHRAHQAWYLHRANAAVPAAERWSLVVGNIRDDMRATMNALAAQHGFRLIWAAVVVRDHRLQVAAVLLLRVGQVLRHAVERLHGVGRIRHVVLAQVLGHHL